MILNLFKVEIECKIYSDVFVSRLHWYTEMYITYLVRIIVTQTFCDHFLEKALGLIKLPKILCIFDFWFE